MEVAQQIVNGLIQNVGNVFSHKNAQQASIKHCSKQAQITINELFSTHSMLQIRKNKLKSVESIPLIVSPRQKAAVHPYLLKPASNSHSRNQITNQTASLGIAPLQLNNFSVELRPLQINQSKQSSRTNTSQTMRKQYETYRNQKQKQRQTNNVPIVPQIISSVLQQKTNKKHSLPISFSFHYDSTILPQKKQYLIQKELPNLKANIRDEKKVIRYSMPKLQQIIGRRVNRGPNKVRWTSMSFYKQQQTFPCPELVAGVKLKQVTSSIIL